MTPKQVHLIRNWSLESVPSFQNYNFYLMHSKTAVNIAIGVGIGEGLQQVHCLGDIKDT